MIDIHNTLSESPKNHGELKKINTITKCNKLNVSIYITFLKCQNYREC